MVVRKAIRGWGDTVKVLPPIDQKDRAEVFRYWLVMHAELLGMTKDREVMAHLRALEEVLAARVADAASGVCHVERRKSRMRGAYIALFKGKYVELFDLQYPEKTDADGKGIDLVIAKLEERHLNFEEYLEWFFEEIGNKPDHAQRAPSIRTTFSHSWLDTYIIQNRSLTEDRAKGVSASISEKALLGRARAMIRSGIKEAYQAVAAFRDGEIAFEEFRAKVEELEKEQET